VEQTDTDIFDTNALADQAPVLTKTWFHTGAYFGMNNILHQLAEEYFQNPSFNEYNLPEPLLPLDLTADEAHEAVRACKGMVLRQEVYALDGNINPELTNYPYSVAEHNNNIIMLQPQGPNLYAVFLSTESESITYHYERNPADPRIAHTLNTAFDEYGNIIDSYAVVYPRQNVNTVNPGGMTLPGGQHLPPAVLLEQLNTYIIYSHNAYTADIITPSTYRLRVACETTAYQLTGISPAAAYFSINDFTNPSATPTVTKLKQQRTLFLKDDLATPLPLYTMDTLGLVYQQYHLAFNATVTALAGKATVAMMQSAKYLESDTYIGTLFPSGDNSDEWWVQSGTMVYDPLHFYLPVQFLDPYGYATSIVYDSYTLLMKSVTDALNNTTSASYDYRVLSPSSVTDPNNNITYFNFDTLGLLVAIAIYGKGEGDVFDAGFTGDLTDAQVAGFFSYPYTNGPALLQGATTRYIYDFVSGGPFSSGIITKQIHAGQLPQIDPRIDITSVPYQYAFEYTDGLGRSAMKKVQADITTGTPSVGSCDGISAPQHQWIGSGKTVYNNKGKPVMQYEPYFSTTPAYEEAPANGVSPVIHYDPVGRVIRTDFPDGSFSKTEFDGWVQIIYDQNDTVNTTDNAWYQQNYYSSDPLNTDAAKKAVANYDTPSSAHLDPLGRNFYTVAYNGGNTFYETQTVLDLESNPLSVIDAIGNTVMQWDYDLLNRPIHQISMDSGERWMLHDIMDKPFTQWDQNGTNAFIYTYSYDFLHRPLQSNVQINGTLYLTAYNIYGEGISINGASDTANNLRTKLYQQFDQSGLVTHYLYDFKGNMVQSSRIFATGFQAANPLLPVILFAGTPSDINLLSTEEYVSLITYDALNRPMLITRPFIPGATGNIIPLPYNQAAVNNADVFVPGYGESGALNTVNLYYGGGNTATPYVARICHNEKGQRLCIQYGNNTVTRYTYDPDTFRLKRLLTTVNSGTSILQDLNYYYDPVGNITYLLDNAQPPVFYNNQQVLSDGNYTYDAVYRLVSATGREQIGQNTMDERPSNTDYRNYPFDIPSSYDSNAMRSYTQYYSYDAVGNMKQLRHVANGGSYTRVFAYNNNSADRTAFGIPAATVINNQLLATTVGTSPAIKYLYDGHGNMLNLPQLPGMSWNYKDEFTVAVQQSVANGGTGLATYYNYDAAGMRSRKVTMSAAPAGGIPVMLSERLYIGGFEVYRTYDSSGNITLQRETLHVMDDKTRIATIDNKTIDTIGADTTSLNTYYPRYQYGNHLGSAAYELDDSGNIVSYEEYHPFGTTSYQAMENSLEVPMKRYRYTGKERDEESGLYYHGARYYAPWLCRWTSVDPIGLKGGINFYQYANSNPLTYCDPKGTAPAPTPEPVPAGVGFIGDYEGISTSWNEAVQKVLEPMYHGGSVEQNMSLFKQAVGKLPPGSNRQAGTGINLARETYSKVRTAFGEIMHAKGMTLPTGTQVHHFFPGLAKNPAGALDASGLIISSGQARVKGSLHNAVHTAEESSTKLQEFAAKHDGSGATAAAQPAEKVAETAKVAESTEAVAKTAVHEGEEAVVQAAKTGGKEALQTAEKEGLMEGAKLLAPKVAKFIPFVGIGVGIALVSKDVEAKEYSTAAVDAVEAIPGVGDVVGAGHFGVAAGGVLSSGLGIDTVASEHGTAVENSLTSLGMSKDNAMLFGATTAGLSAITVAPTIALERKVMSLFN